MLAAVASSEEIDNFNFFDMAMPREPDNMINYPLGIFVYFIFLISLNKDIDPTASMPLKALLHLLRLCCFVQKLHNLCKRECSSAAKKQTQHSKEQMNTPAASFKSSLF